MLSPFLSGFMGEASNRGTFIFLTRRRKRLPEPEREFRSEKFWPSVLWLPWERLPGNPFKLFIPGLPAGGFGPGISTVFLRFEQAMDFCPFPATMRGKSSFAVNPGLLVGARCIVPLRL